VFRGLGIWFRGLGLGCYAPLAVERLTREDAEGGVKSEGGSEEIAHVHEHPVADAFSQRSNAQDFQFARDLALPAKKKNPHRVNMYTNPCHVSILHAHWF